MKNLFKNISLSLPFARSYYFLLGHVKKYLGISVLVFLNGIPSSIPSKPCSSNHAPQCSNNNHRRLAIFSFCVVANCLRSGIYHFTRFDCKHMQNDGLKLGCAGRAIPLENF